MDLKRRARNQIIEAIRDGGLDPAECSVGYEDDTDLADNVVKANASVVVVHPAPASFRFWDTTTFPSVEYGVTYFVYDGPHANRKGQSWNQVIRELTEWATEVQYINENPDLWAELEKAAALRAAVAQADEALGSVFTEDEQSEVSERLDQIAEELRSSRDLTAMQLRAIDHAIKELKEKAGDGRTTRKDWRLLLYGQAMNLFFTYSVPPHVVQGIITTVITGLGHIFGLGGGPPPSLPQA